MIPSFGNFEIKGDRGWIAFYFGLLGGKIKRNKWIFAVMAAMIGWIQTRSR
jgi:hypothetical protein